MTMNYIRQYKWLVVASSIIFFLMLLAYALVGPDDTLSGEANDQVWTRCRKAGFALDSQGLTCRRAVTPLPSPRAERCHIAGLASIDQYRQYLHNTDTTCNNMRPFGGKPPAPDAGKKFVCMDDRFNLKPGDCLVFSFGIGNEWSFEDEFDKFGCKVYAYDPTMGKENHQRSPNIRFFATGIANYKGTKKVGMGKNWNVHKVDRFENLVREAGQEGREIDYVKLDVELSEIDFLQDMLFNSPQVLARIKQIAMEVHDGPFKNDLSQTSRHQVFWPYFMLMRCAGFQLIHTRETWGWREVVWARSY